MLSDAIYTILTEDADVSALVSDRVYPQLSPQNPTYPFLVYKIEEDENVRDYQGHSGLVKYRLTVFVAALTYSGVESLRKKTKDALEVVDSVVGDVEIQGIFPSIDVDEIESELEAGRLVYTGEVSAAVWAKGDPLPSNSYNYLDEWHYNSLLE